ncbi:MAG TPA: FAD-dependent monooxygenase, partial [Kofleriaceae bacterium]|nr:FAD-dependent monooxygenase [Kofleriaceae bacterium]
MNTVCIGGGPAGLYLGILLKLADPHHRVTVFERNRADDTFGFGVVFSEATLGHLAAADPVSHGDITRHFARWDAIETHWRDHVFTSTGHGFCGLERKQLLLILQARARELGVDVLFECEIKSLDEVAGADLIVACDGVGSWVRSARADAFGPDVDVRPNRFVWLGTTVPYRAFTFIFLETPYGLFRVHAYPYSETGSTFIVECTPKTWEAARFTVDDEDRTIAILERLFVDHLGGHRLIKNRSIWRSFPTVRNRSWRAGNVVLMGDAAHTAHFSIGSGTKLAMEDAIALRDALVEAGVPGPGVAVETALAAYEARRRPDVEALQAAAQASLEWFEGTERYLELPPVQFAYSLLTRSLRVSHASMQRRDPALAEAVEDVIAAEAGLGGTVPAPAHVPTQLDRLPLPGRIALAPWPLHAAERGVVGDDHLVFLGARAQGGAALVFTEPTWVHTPDDGAAAAIATDEQAVAWRRIVEFVHGRSDARCAIDLCVELARPRALDDLRDATWRAAFAGFDLLQLDVGADAGDALHHDWFRLVISIVRMNWPAARPLALRLRRGADDAATCAGVVRWRELAPVVSVAPADGVGGRRLDAAPLADRLRHEAGVA